MRWGTEPEGWYVDLPYGVVVPLGSFRRRTLNATAGPNARSSDTVGSKVGFRRESLGNQVRVNPLGNPTPAVAERLKPKGAGSWRLNETLDCPVLHSHQRWSRGRGMLP